MNEYKTVSPGMAIGTAFAFTLSLLLTGCSRQGAGHEEDAHQHEGEHDEHDEHEGEEVELTAAQIELAGIRVEPAAGGELSRRLTLPAVAAPDADSVTHVNPKAPGIVRSIHKHLGEEVEEGALMCVIDSVDLGNAVARYVRASALVEAAETTLERERALFQGRLETAERVLAQAVELDRRIYEREQELREKAVSTIRPLLEAEKALQRSELEKERDLTDLRAARDTRLLALEIDVRERRIDQDAASNTLVALGVDSALLDELAPGSSLLAGAYEIRAPRRGIVSGRHITTGEFVDAETKLYTLEDLSQVWILASAFEGQIQSVRTGQPGAIHLDAFPGRTFEGHVTMIGYQVDPRSRALRVRLELDNPTLPDWTEAYPIRPGMFGSVDLVVHRIQARVVIPESAVLHEDGGDYVFVRTAPGVFERRHVELGPPSGEVVEVREGLEPGEDVAVTGTFRLKSALRQGELGGGHSH